ncbi:cadmium-translocating P-type ATPase [Enterovibrio sp. ZSDZ35]|uniref:Cadmium-translocating P-type ATPase n=1 Tax=Enterovibrio qingdaonensis TaxID=2899818 RepID=A0ABT5QIB6_9GAMM|nr:heavy metal translocating P-type ATPase [Enterovibrio sp. ZSDZ35]MDD1780726.1 cadmium-translocating P-type ATPase [Enterovibrio sp. ZSDZ35]
MTKDCYHCGEPVLTGDSYQVEILGIKQIMCCPGCQAVATTIVASGLTSYYEYRTEPAEKANLVPQELQSLSLYDNEDVQQEFVRHENGIDEVVLSVDGVSCAACAWLIEKQLSSQIGVSRIQVNTTTHRATLRWDPTKTKLSDLLAKIHALGYKAAPFEADNQEAQYHHTMKQYLYRLGVAGLATMQVMMLAVAMYFEVFGDMDETFRNYFRWVSLIFATPVLLYSAMPFYVNAWRNLKARTLGMDVPVSIALLFAYFASLYATVTEKGEVFFESIAMFTFFLLIGRFLEMRARRTAAAASANLLKLVPKLALLQSGEQIPAKSLKLGHIVRVLPGEPYPADGTIVSGVTTVDEAMLTGESLPQSKHLGDVVFAGTMNIDGNVDVEVTAEKKDSLIAHIVQLQDEAQLAKPRLAEIADIVARYFVAVILIISASTWWYWQGHRPDDAFWIMLSVLVATCPCALSLATPTALTCSTSTFGKLGILLRRGHVFETLTKINRVVIDKTGTLTEGNISISETDVFSDVTKDTALSIASALESYANHPIAVAFHRYPQAEGVTDVENVIGEGLKGYLDGQEWRIGKPAFALNAPEVALNSPSQVWLSCDGQPIASFKLVDPVRASSKALIEQFHNAGIRVTMLTGDNVQTATTVANALGIDEVVADVSPQGKLEYLQSLPNNQITMMIGDGVNDAPVLAGAHLSVAMGGGTDVAKASADMVLLGDDLTKLLDARKLAAFTQKIIRQNLAWALGYNVVILPLAMAGFVAPYVAVAGMSASSVIVVTNSLRLFKKDIIEKLKDAP